MTKKRTAEEMQETLGPVALFVRHERRALDYTQEEFALRVGIGVRFLRDLEQGKPTVRMDKVNQVLNYLGHELSPAPIKKRS